MKGLSIRERHFTNIIFRSLLNVIADRGHDIDLGYWFLEENPTWLGPLLDDSIGVTKTRMINTQANHVDFEPSMYTEECALPTELDRLYAYFKSQEVYLHKSYHDIRYNHVEFKPLGMYSDTKVHLHVASQGSISLNLFYKPPLKTHLICLAYAQVSEAGHPVTLLQPQG
ncbi:unnamed protein product [Prunus armeniaca]|uniref:Uncharacterized protein n=1 Tax=Prunus armeniaca TaxID=36596 RepID=A0A6J5U2W7_PRUAR|nr:unnamed protein product [Prunus armeniaca]